MKTNVTQYDFTQAFKAYGRDSDFSYAGLQALFDYLEELEEDTGQEIELDVISLCCDYAEYETALEAAREYGCDYSVPISDDDDNERPPEEIAEELEEYCLDWLRDRTTVIEFDGGLIVEGF